MSESRWVKEGDFSKALAPEIQANCQYFVKYIKDGVTLSLFKRALKKDPNVYEFKIQLGNLAPEQVNTATSDNNTAVMNPHHSHGLFHHADGILGEYNSNVQWLTKNISYIDRLVGLNEIKDEVYQCLEIHTPFLEAKREICTTMTSRN